MTNDEIAKKLSNYMGVTVTVTDEGWLVPFAERKRAINNTLPDQHRLVGKYGEYAVYDLTGALTTTGLDRTWPWTVIAGPGAKARVRLSTYKSKEAAVSRALMLMRNDALGGPERPD